MRDLLRTAWRARGIAVFRCILVAAAIASPAGLSRPAIAQAVKAEVSAGVENGYARLIFRFDEEVQSDVRLANNILTLTFPRPVDISVDRISANAHDYISVARRDPDGKGVRIALARKVTMNSMAAGDRLFVDLLPDTWSGLPPGLPRDVIEELARRARDAEKRARQQRALSQQSKMAPVRVKVVTQPTFTRYLFDLPELIGVTSDNTRDRLTLTFDAVLRFDLADAQATLPSTIESLSSEADHDTVVVRFNFAAKVDVRTFREDNSFVVDVESAERRQASDGAVRSDELSSLAAELAARKKDASKVGAPKTVPATPPAAGADSAPSRSPPPQSTPAQKDPPRPPAPEAKAPPQPPPVQGPAPPAGQKSAEPPLQQPDPKAAAEQGPAMPPASAPAKQEPPVPPAEPTHQDTADTGRPATGDGAVKAELTRQGDHVRLLFPFRAPTPAAVFRRADSVWLVFDTEAAIAVAALNAEVGKSIRRVSSIRRSDSVVVRITLDRPQLISVGTEGNGWAVTLGNEVVEPTSPLLVSRNIIESARSSITIPIENARSVHRINDPDAGDVLFVVTALGPARGLLKSQDFVEFRALASAHGVALQPLADDLRAEFTSERLIVSRPGGLSLSAGGNASAPSIYRRHVIDMQSWGFDRQADFTERRSQLIMAAADAPEPRRLAARSDLAHFYLARDMFAEAKGVLDTALADSPASVEDSATIVLRAIANIMIGRADAAIKDLSNPFVGNQHDAQLWRAFANARLGKWTDARGGFRDSEGALATLPVEFQRTLLKDMLRASLEVGDVTGAVSQLNEFELIGIPRELEPAISILAGRLAEGLGRVDDALRAYRVAADSMDRPAASQGKLREIQLQYGRGHLKRGDAINDLETLTAIWRGDQTEIEALQLLARLYTEEQRYRDAFSIMRTALRVHPNSDMSRRIQDEAMSTFDKLFLAGRGDALPAIDALALFYDFRELTPIGRRGDEMIRRLADRLVAVDLLYQAGELLLHQVEHRLQGAARAQVATRLAVIYMMDRKPDRALAVLRATRVTDLNNELRNQRLMLEARALSDLGRHDVAFEVVANIEGKEAIRLRSDILWAGRKYVQAAEQIEALYGDRWQEFTPLNDIERADVMRAAIGYALGEDAIGLARFRERYLSRMGEGPDARAFEVVTAPLGTTGTEFREIVRSIAAVDTLEAFLRDLRARYPESGATPASQPQPQDGRPPAAPAAITPPSRTAAG